MAIFVGDQSPYLGTVQDRK